MVHGTDDLPDGKDGIEEQIRRLSASGDLLDVARQMREMGVESLLFARPDGRITAVVTDRQIAHLAGVIPSTPELRPTVTPVAPAAEVVPAQGVPVAQRADEVDTTGAGVSRR